ncbi:prolyl oligopeptidase family serine peptidase [Iamia sp. SCSIO 61187]|uniref:alpha/beta hydrolase n=1 Tax=Iamia sp. SCSIO 61187 TaxID=2722752 RepID=UPI001C638B6A|nr:alpha/beta hydrolase-fold protein [Iamia sp. SCSIO 61187]QYG91977.1 prolyl oligopeptidase family serine peptidase [Iamia sp. SCSIO 61187]
MPPQIDHHLMSSSHAPTDVEVRILASTPTEGLPLILLLHGAMSSARSVDLHAPIVRELWTSGALPPCVVACASTPTEGGFYLDWPDGPSWAAVVAEDLPRFVSEQYDVDLSRTALMGASMGGFGALTMVLGQPARFVAGAALAPAVFPGTTRDDVPAQNREGVLGELFEVLEVAPHQRVDARLSENLEAVHRHAPAIFLGVGEQDEFRLRDGAEHLHAQLLAAEVSHQYLVIAGGGHMDAGMEELQRAALQFLGRALVGRSG